MRYRVIKTYGHDLGLSCCFRQWRAKHSHCRFMHGYSLGFKLEFGSDILNENNWVIDFGGLKYIKEFLTSIFDHKTVVAQDDPHLNEFKALHDKGIIDMIVLPDVGCEKFAEYVFTTVNKNYDIGDVKLLSVEVMEHGANSAKYTDLFS